MSIVDHKITEQQIADYGLNSLPDLLTGTAGENKTAMQKLLVLIGIPAINAAIDELALVEAQADDWAVAEAARAAAERLRAAAEEARATAEQGRASAESSRVTAESGRVTAETGRVNAESARVSAESARATNESSRQTAESGRATAESGRVSAETNRVSAESSRVSAESGRVREENLRVDAELQRVNTFAEQVEQANKSRVEAQTSAEAAELSEANARQHAEDALRSENSIQVFVGENPPTDGSKLIQIIDVEEPESFQAATIQEVNAAMTAYNTREQIAAVTVGTLIATYGVREALRRFVAANADMNLTAACDCFFGAAAGTGKIYTSQFYCFDVSNAAAGEKLDDNAGMVCVPSTATIAGQDDYATLPLFCPIDCNYTIDATTLDVVITEIDGITNGFSRTTPKGLCGVMQMTGWVHRYNDGTNRGVHYSDTKINSNYKPLPEAVRVDGTVRNFVVHAKYVAGYDADGTLTSASGLNPVAYNTLNTANSISHNGQIAMWRKRGNQYSGESLCDRAFMQTMLEVKYANLGNAGIMNGCRSYSVQYKVAAAETGVQRVLLTPSQATNFIVGSCVVIGHSTDRATVASRDVANMVRITDISDVEISGTTYGAVTVDNGGTSFDVDADAYIGTSPWWSGWCDTVLGNDGSQINPTSNKEPFIIQGIETMVGAYEVLADTVLNYNGDGTASVMVCKTAAQLASGSAGNSPEALEEKIANQNTADAWRYVSTAGLEQIAATVPVETLAAGSSVGYKAGAYLKKADDTGLYEWLAGGNLTNGGYAGLSCLVGSYGLGYAYWYIAARASGSGGNRGEYGA